MSSVRASSPRNVAGTPTAEGGRARPSRTAHDFLGLDGIGELASTRDDVAGALFRAMRRRAGMPAETLARRLATHEATLALLEAGELRAAAVAPDLDRVVERYARLCGIDPAPLLQRLELATLPDPTIARRAAEEQVPGPWQTPWPEIEPEPQRGPASTFDPPRPVTPRFDPPKLGTSPVGAPGVVAPQPGPTPPWPVASPAPSQARPAVAEWGETAPVAPAPTLPVHPGATHHPVPDPVATRSEPTYSATETVPAAVPSSPIEASPSVGPASPTARATRSAAAAAGERETEARPGSARSNRLQRRLLRAGAVATLAALLAGTVTLAAHSGAMHCAAAALPGAIGSFARNTLERALLATTRRENGFSLIDLSRPACRKTDKLRDPPA